MKLDKKDTDKIAVLYNLGEVKSVRLLSGGMISYNYVVKTSKGEFIVRKLGYKIEGWWARQKELEFEVVEYLHKKSFPYQIPRFIKNNKGDYISKLHGNLFEAYERIPGRKIVKLNDKQFREMAKALAIYHKIIKSFPLREKFRRIDDYKWMLGKYSLLRKAKPETKLDKLMLNNLDFYEDLLKRLLKYDLKQNPLVNHSDFSVYNLLWKKDKLVGVLDFENVSYKPRVSDIAYLLRRMNKKKVLVDTYRKHSSLSKEEEGNLIVSLLFNFCNRFWWTYLEMKKRPDLKYNGLLRAVKDGRKYAKMLKELK